MPSMMTSLRTLPAGDIEIIDQLLLPHTTLWVPIRTITDAHSAIKRMQIRGAPAIASLAALTLARELEVGLAAADAPGYLESVDALRAHVGPALDYLNTARPTAVNLGQAMRRLRVVLDADGSGDVRALAETLVATGRLVAAEDVGRNREMARHGAEWVLDRVARREGQRRKLNVLTVCNTGSLATSVRSSADDRLCALTD
jgi:methylthioribose-1-phosphate isomerase